MFVKNEKKAEKCRGCEYLHLIQHIDDDYPYYGCYRGEARGKDVAEISDCPKKGRCK